APALLLRGRVQGRGAPRRPRGRLRQGVRRRDGRARDERGAAGVRRLRLFARVPGAALLARRAGVPDLRGDERDPVRGDRPAAPGVMTKKTTRSGIEIKPLYTAADLAPDLDARLGAPGEYPFARGIYPTMYRGKLWTMRQYAGFGTPRETNERFRYLLAEG